MAVGAKDPSTISQEEPKRKLHVCFLRRDPNVGCGAGANANKPKATRLQQLCTQLLFTPEVLGVEATGLCQPAQNNTNRLSSIG